MCGQGRYAARLATQKAIQTDAEDVRGSREVEGMCRRVMSGTRRQSSTWAANRCRAACRDTPKAVPMRPQLVCRRPEYGCRLPVDNSNCRLERIVHVTAADSTLRWGLLDATHWLVLTDGRTQVKRARSRLP